MYRERERDMYRERKRKKERIQHRRCSCDFILLELACAHKCPLARTVNVTCFKLNFWYRRQVDVLNSNKNRLLI